METIFEWKIAFRNLFRNKWRSLATTSAIVTGFCGICLLAGYIIRVENYLRVSTIYINQLGHFSIYAKDGVDFFYLNPKKYQLKTKTLNEIYQVLNEPHFKKNIEFTGEYLTGMGLISNGKRSHPFIAKGVDPEISRKISEHPLVKKWTSELAMSEQGVDFSSAIKNYPETISVTKELGELLGLTPPFLKEDLSKREVQLAGRTVYGDLNAINALVSLQHTTGLSLAEDTGLLAPINVLKQLYAIDGISNLAVYLNENVISTGEVIKKLSERFEKEGIKAEVVPYYDERIGQFYVGTMAFLYIMAFFFVSLICSAVAISIVNAMTMGILERTREIGTMRSLGLSSKSIARMFTKEAVLMTIFGSLVGIILSQGISAIISSLKIRFYPPGIAGSMQFVLVPTWWLFILVSLVMIILAVVTGYYVSKKKASLKIVHLLTDASR